MVVAHWRGDELPSWGGVNDGCVFERLGFSVFPGFRVAVAHWGVSDLRCG